MTIYPPSRRGKVPYSETKAQQIAADIMSEVNLGNLKPRDFIPTTKQLIELYKVSHWTTKRAREILHEKGIVGPIIKGLRPRIK